MQVRYIIELGRIKDVRLSFNLIIDNGETSTYANRNKRGTVHSYVAAGMENHIFSPHPYISVDLRSYQDRMYKEYNKNLVFTLNKFNLYRICRFFASIKNTIRTSSDIFVMMDDHVILNPNVEKTKLEHCLLLPQHILNVKLSMIVEQTYAEIPDAPMTPGVQMWLNQIANAVELSMEDFYYLDYMLTSINMNSLAMQCLQIHTQRAALELDTTNEDTYYVNRNDERLKKTYDTETSEVTGFFGQRQLPDNVDGLLTIPEKTDETS